MEQITELKKAQETPGIQSFCFSFKTAIVKLINIR